MATRATKKTIKTINKMLIEMDQTEQAIQRIEVDIKDLEEMNKKEFGLRKEAIIQKNLVLIDKLNNTKLDLTATKKNIPLLIKHSQEVVNANKKSIELYITIDDFKLLDMVKFSKRLLIKNQKKYKKKYEIYDIKYGTKCVEKINNFLDNPGEIYEDPTNPDLSDESVTLSDESEKIEEPCSLFSYLFSLCSEGTSGGKSRRKYKSRKRRTRRNR